MSHEGQLNYAVNRQLALSSLKGNVRAIKFNGKDKASYAPWKTALELETGGLLLSDAEWLEILQLRTSDIALEVVKSGRELALVDTNQALQFIWDNFDKNYGEQFQLADVLLKKLQAFPVVSLDTPENLHRFNTLCEQARILATTTQGRSLLALDCKDMQKTVNNRLDKKLKSK